ncbi:MAG: hypothetical protein C4K60_09590 [Ideonella sp. MAG2]|nr:MAG: hypothetical protein C4K60_09590 [Ideonella sp. MAG2]
MTPALTLSPIVAGAWRLAEWNFSLAQRLAWVEGCQARGLSSFDHADIYGGYQAEALFGEVLAQSTVVNLPAFWRRSVSTGTCARQWARRWQAQEDAAQSAGLLQGMGHLILCHCLPEPAMAAFGPYNPQAVLSTGHDLAERERAVFGVAHPEVSAWWAAEMGLPDQAVQAIEQSLAPPQANYPALTRAVMAACLMSSHLERGMSADAAMAVIEPMFQEEHTPDLSD